MPDHDEIHGRQTRGHPNRHLWLRQQRDSERHVQKSLHAQTQVRIRRGRLEDAPARTDPRFLLAACYFRLCRGASWAALMAIETLGLSTVILLDSYFRLSLHISYLLLSCCAQIDPVFTNAWQK